LRHVFLLGAKRQVANKNTHCKLGGTEDVESGEVETGRDQLGDKAGRWA
jgi:hypothetical protein